MPLTRRIQSLQNRGGKRGELRLKDRREAVLLMDESGDHAGDHEAGVAFSLANDAYAFFLSSFARDSFNNGGRRIDIYLHRGNQTRIEEFTHTPAEDFVSLGDGDGINYHSPLLAPDIVYHELVHGYMTYLSTAEYGLSESGAVIEHLCDAFAWLIRTSMVPDGRSWEIGAGYPVGGGAMRNLKEPNDAGVVMKGATHIREVRKAANQETLYFNAGLLGRVFAQSVEDLGPTGRRICADVWYNAAGQLPRKPTFRIFREQVCGFAGGKWPNARPVLENAFAQAGL